MSKAFLASLVFTNVGGQGRDSMLLYIYIYIYIGLILKIWGKYTVEGHSQILIMIEFII